MKIGLVCPYNIGLGGGVQECVKAMQAELKRRGHEVLIITPMSKEVRDNPPADTIMLGTGTDIRSPFATTAQVSATFNTDEIEAVLSQHNFDILHFHEPWVPMLARQLLAKSKSKTVNVATFHARMPDGVMTRTIERVITPYTRSILKSFDVLTAVSEPAAQYVKSLSDAPIQIVPNGIDLDVYRPQTHAKSQANQRTILFIGRLERRKGLKYLLDAFARLNDPSCRLLIAGNGPDRQKLEEYTRKLKLDNVEYLGFVSQAKKLELLAEADVFCSPAVYGESFGIVLLEAMAAGVPVVAANNPGYASVMQGRGFISLVDPKDIEQFAKRLALMLYDEELAELWRKWALECVRQFSYKDVVDHYETIYTSLVKTNV